VLRMRTSLDTLNKELDAKIDAIMKSVVLGKKIVVDQLAAGLAEHEKLLKDIQERLALLVSKSGVNDRLSVDLDLLRDHYKVVSRRQKQNSFDKVMGGTGNIDVLVANHGVAPNRPYFPPPFVLCVIVALLTGLVVSFSVVIVADILDQSFKTPDEVERALATPVLGTIPKRPKHRLTALLGA
jgi:succinoglycan biosynthesis transport protein ExoP